MSLIPLILATSLTTLPAKGFTSDQIYFSFARTENMRKGLAELIVPTKQRLPTPILTLGLEATDSYFPQGEIKRYNGNVLVSFGGEKNFG